MLRYYILKSLFMARPEIIHAFRAKKSVRRPSSEHRWNRRLQTVVVKAAAAKATMMDYEEQPAGDQMDYEETYDQNGEEMDMDDVPVTQEDAWSVVRFFRVMMLLPCLTAFAFVLFITLNYILPLVTFFCSL